MELSQEKKTQIAACHGKGMTVKEIAKAAKLTEGQVDVFLQSIGKRPLYRRYSKTKKDETEKKYNRVTDEQKKEIFELLAQGKGTTEIAQLTGINVKTVNNYKHRRSKEKEPAAAATVTDSQKTDVVTDNSTVSISKDNIIEAKCQVLAKALKLAHKGIIAQYEEMSHECQLAFDLGQLFAEIEQRMKEGGVEVE